MGSIHGCSEATFPTPDCTQQANGITEPTRTYAWAALKVHTRYTPSSHAPPPRKAQRTARMTHLSRIEHCTSGMTSHHLVPDGTLKEQSLDTESTKTKHLLLKNYYSQKKKKATTKGKRTKRKKQEKLTSLQ